MGADDIELRKVRRRIRGGPGKGRGTAVPLVCRSIDASEVKCAGGEAEPIT